MRQEAIRRPRASSNGSAARTASARAVAMKLEIVDADFGDPGHREGILEILNAYAAQPMGGGEPEPTRFLSKPLDVTGGG